MRHLTTPVAALLCEVEKGRAKRRSCGANAWSAAGPTFSARSRSRIGQRSLGLQADLLHQLAPGRVLRLHVVAGRLHGAAAAADELRLAHPLHHDRILEHGVELAVDPLEDRG